MQRTEIKWKFYAQRNIPINKLKCHASLQCQFTSVAIYVITAKAMSSEIHYLLLVDSMIKWFPLAMMHVLFISKSAVWYQSTFQNFRLCRNCNLAILSIKLPFDRLYLFDLVIILLGKYSFCQIYVCIMAHSEEFIFWWLKYIVCICFERMR